MTPIAASSAALRFYSRRTTHAIPQQFRPQVWYRISQRWQSTLLHRAAPHLPRILQPSTWETVIPPSMRLKTKELFSGRQKKSTNPATYFIWIYVLIGSQAIRILQVKNEYASYSRKSDLQIEKLREVVRKLQAGEEVDVEKVLGTGVPEEEDAWEEALKEIEREERIWTESKRQKRERRQLEKEQREREELERADASPVRDTNLPTATKSVKIQPDGSSSQAPFKAPGFY